MQIFIPLQLFDLRSSGSDLSYNDMIIQNILIYSVVFYLSFGFLESLVARLFHKHFFIHAYLRKKKLDQTNKYILHKEFPFYQKLNLKGQKYFDHRVVVFLDKYTFYGKEDFQITNEVKLIVAGTYVMLSYGMRDYLSTVFNKIIIYPSEYYSTYNEQYHKGEFNVNVKAVAFSWDYYLSGHQNNSDNLNLGIHEFVHVLHYQSQKSQELSFIIFSDLYDKIIKYVTKQKNLDRIIASNYFRVYAFTNHNEFLSVILEHFFETPSQFQSEFPELFYKVQKLINYNQKYFLA